MLSVSEQSCITRPHTGTLHSKAFIGIEDVSYSIATLASKECIFQQVTRQLYNSVLSP